MELSKFKKHDWNGFAGAEEFQDGSAPLIGELNFILNQDTPLGNSAIVIVDRYSISVITETGMEFSFDGKNDLSQLIRTACFLSDETSLADLIQMGFNPM